MYETGSERGKKTKGWQKYRVAVNKVWRQSINLNNEEPYIQYLEADDKTHRNPFRVMHVMWDTLQPPVTVRY